MDSMVNKFDISAVIEAFYRKYRYKKDLILAKQKVNRTPEEVLWLQMFRKYSNIHSRYNNPMNEVRVKFFTYFKKFSFKQFDVLAYYIDDNDGGEIVERLKYNQKVSNVVKKISFVYKNLVFAEAYALGDEVFYEICKRQNEKHRADDRRKVEQAQDEFIRIMNIKSPKWVI